ncbi:MAG: DUF1800 family protein [Verrucomicrobiota bacterium]
MSLRLKGFVFAYLAIKKHSYLFLWFVLFSTLSAEVDENTNQLSDVWEQYYGGVLLLAGEDFDGDAFTNEEESIAGTNPFDANDAPKLQLKSLRDGVDEIQFETQKGRTYQVFSTYSLDEDFKPHSRWQGDGGMRRLRIQYGVTSTTTSQVEANFWNGVSGSDFSAFSGLGRSDGRLFLEHLEALPFMQTGFAAELVGMIKIPETQEYTFHISSSGPAQLEALIDGQYVVLATIPEGQSIIEQGEFQRFPSQTSNRISLSKGERLRLRLRYFARAQNQHCQVAWSWVGSNGPVIIGRESMSEIAFEGRPVDSNSLFAYDYDSPGQQGGLGGNSSRIRSDPDGPGGMTGEVQYINSQIGKSSERTIPWNSPTDENAYFTWLLHVPDDSHNNSVLEVKDSTSATSGSVVGPRIRIRGGDPGSANLVAGGNAPNEAEVNLKNGMTYRIELLMSLSPRGLRYQTPTGVKIVRENTFDLYISDADGQLLASQQGLNFASNVSVNPIQMFDSFAIENSGTANYYVDEFFATTGAIPGLGYLPGNQSSAAEIEDSVVFSRDYDTGESQGRFWSKANSSGSELASGPGGMTGNTERVFGNLGNRNKRTAVFSPNGPLEKLYATWLFNMGQAHGNIAIIFQNANDRQKEGPALRFLGDGNGVQAIGDSNAGEQIALNLDQTYRVELVTSASSEELSYSASQSPVTVQPGTYDVYISTLDSRLVGSMTGMNFKDADPGGFSAIVLDEIGQNAPNIYLDEFYITSGKAGGFGYLDRTAPTPDQQFFTLEVIQSDQDEDGLSDWEEIQLGSFSNSLFFNPQSDGNNPDVNTAIQTLSGAEGIPEIEFFCTDRDAYENNYPSITKNNGEITVRRSGALTPLAVSIEIVPMDEPINAVTVCDGSCCSLTGTLGEEGAEAADYIILDERGNEITDTVYFKFGEVEKVLTVVAVNDSINEYPETLTLRAGESANGAYTLSETVNGAEILLFDLPDHPENRTLFTGAWVEDFAVGIVPNPLPSGFMFASLNGTRTEIRITAEFSGLSSKQRNVHVHKENVDETPGDIVFGITDPESNGSDPLIGPFQDYLWDLTAPSNPIAMSSTDPSRSGRQVVIDSLFRQNGETRLYLNLHTRKNKDGEVMAFFDVTGGSIPEPAAPEAPAAPGSAGYPLLSGDLLEVDVRRFLNQATFGATEDQVQSLLSYIVYQRINGNPDYHRKAAFEEWLDIQMDPNETPQTYILDFWLASVHQHLGNGGFFDTSNYDPGTSGLQNVPAYPSEWPTILRNSAQPEDWELSLPFVVTQEEMFPARSIKFLNTVTNGSGVDEFERAIIHAMINGRDQLRQKMGYALQQILVVSTSGSAVVGYSSGAANYQDMLNAYAFSTFRDVLGYVNWSPMMAKWLSSLGNQKAIDFDGDGFFDSYPDENLARENMQLFSIGLFEIWPDGTLKLTSDGLPRPTYTNADITEFAKILTGQGFGSTLDSEDNDGRWGGPDYQRGNATWSSLSGRFDRINRVEYLYPMKMFGDFHAGGPKTFAGITIDNTDEPDLTEMGIQDVNQAIDWLAGNPYDNNPSEYDMVNSHISTPAFVSRRLIQRFTTSNPSREYLHRVAQVFKDTEGSLSDTLQAILLDPEARNIDLSNNVFGLKRSPLESFIFFTRALGAQSKIPLYPPGPNEYPFSGVEGVDYTNPNIYLDSFGYPQTQFQTQETNSLFGAKFNPKSSASIIMEPFKQETVFNFYLPDFSPAGPLADSGLFAPELQIATEPAVISNINFFENYIMSSGINASGIKGQNSVLGNPSSGGQEKIGIDIFRLANDELYPSVPPTAINGRSSISLADEMLVDALDDRLTNGMFRLKYPYDPNDSTENPREIIIDTLTQLDDPFDGRRDSKHREEKLEDALYLFMVSPEFQVRK